MGNNYYRKFEDDDDDEQDDEENVDPYSNYSYPPDHRQRLPARQPRTRTRFSPLEMSTIPKGRQYADLYGARVPPPQRPQQQNVQQQFLGFQTLLRQQELHQQQQQQQHRPLASTSGYANSAIAGPSSFMQQFKACQSQQQAPPPEQATFLQQLAELISTQQVPPAQQQPGPSNRELADAILQLASQQQAPLPQLAPQPLPIEKPTFNQLLAEALKQSLPEAPQICNPPPQEPSGQSAGPSNAELGQAILKLAESQAKLSQDIQNMDDLVWEVEDDTVEKTSDVPNENVEFVENVVIQDEDFEEITHDGCYCLKTRPGSHMVECSKCMSWFHLACVGLTQKSVPVIYNCKACKSQSGGGENTSVENSTFSASSAKEARINEAVAASASDVLPKKSLAGRQVKIPKGHPLYDIFREVYENRTNDKKAHAILLNNIIESLKLNKAFESFPANLQSRHLIVDSINKNYQAIKDRLKFDPNECLLACANVAESCEGLPKFGSTIGKVGVTGRGEKFVMQRKIYTFKGSNVVFSFDYIPLSRINLEVAGYQNVRSLNLVSNPILDRGTFGHDDGFDKIHVRLAYMEPSRVDDKKAAMLDLLRSNSNPDFFARSAFYSQIISCCGTLTEVDPWTGNINFFESHDTLSGIEDEKLPLSIREKCKIMAETLDRKYHGDALRVYKTTYETIWLKSRNKFFGKFTFVIKEPLFKVSGVLFWAQKGNNFHTTKDLHLNPEFFITLDNHYQCVQTDCHFKSRLEKEALTHALSHTDCFHATPDYVAGEILGSVYSIAQRA